MLSGLAIDNDDPLSRRDQGLEFLDVTARVRAQLTDRDIDAGAVKDTYRLTNTSSSLVDTHLLLVVRGLPRTVWLRNASGTTRGGDPYLRLFLREGVLSPGQRVEARLSFTRPPRAAPPAYSLTLLSGQGAP